MKDRLSLGQFCNIDSPIRRIDPRIKLHLFLIYAIAAFLISGMPGMIGMLAILVIVIALSKIPVLKLISSLKVCWIICLIPLIFNLFNPSGDILVQIAAIKITEQGLYLAIFYTLRLALLLASASMILLTTSTLELCKAIEYLLRPFAKLKLPVEDISMSVSIAIRFIPTMSKEYFEIRDAQAARGAVFDEGGPIRRAKAMIPVLAPLLVGAWRRTESLAMAMESRCYGCGITRTAYRELKCRASDWLALAIMLVYAIAAGICL